jgi:hypothetical protein
MVLRSRIATGLAISVAAGSIAGGALAAGGGGGQKTSGTAYIGPTPKSSKNLLYDAGFNVDKVLGNGAITYTIKPLASTKPGTLTAKAQKVTLWTSTGSLTGTGTATVTITNKPDQGDATVSGGKLKLNRGSGGQAGHSLVATFSGKGNVDSGQYIFKYKGTYK